MSIGLLNFAAVLIFCSTMFVARVNAQPVILGWQTPWATQGQLVMGLKHTNLPSLVGIDLKYVGFAYGGPLNQAALAREVDILLTADQPAIALLSRTSDYKIVARMMYNRTCLYVPPTSHIHSLGDLVGTRISGPVGAAAERIAMKAIQDAGVDLNTIQFGNLNMAQQAALLVRGAQEGRWSTIDALYGFDPLPAQFESRKIARMLNCGKVVSVVIASRDMIENRSETLERFLRAFYLSWHQYATHPQEMNQIFTKDSSLEISPQALDISAAIEPNLNAKSLLDIRMTLEEDDYAIFDQASDFLFSRKKIKTPIDIRNPNYIDMGPIKAVLKMRGEAETLIPLIKLH